MSVMWQYKPNEEREEFFCDSCTDHCTTPYFTGGIDMVVCLRCAKVLAKAYKMAMERMEGGE